MSAHPPPEPDCEALADSLVAGSAPGAEAPLPPVRGARVLAAGEACFTRLDTLIERAWPRAWNPLAQLGPAANAMLLLASLSGVLMLIWYSASVQSAWSSLAGLGPRSVGGIVRSVHRYSSDLTVLLVLLHAARTLFARKFAGPRWLAWASGLAMLGLIWFIGWTGYWLVWDERAQLVATGTMKAVDVLPVFGEPMLPLFNRDETVPSLLFFVVFFLHMALPMAIAGGLALHLARLSRARLLPDRRLSAGLTVAVIGAALILPATHAAPAQLAVKPAAFTMDWWYLWPLQLTARLSGPGLWLAAGLSLLVLVTVPWWLARRRPRATFQATVDVARCFACTLCSHDCPFGAITMVPRTDGKPFPAQAQVDPDRCIGCGICAGACDTQGIGLAWFDARRVGRELEELVATECAGGTRPAIAFVCVQGDGGWELFDHVGWARRLPGYTVRPVPCAGWVEPKLIERLVTKGAAAVLIVGCGSAEAFGREGNVWMPARLAGTREPALRPNRAAPHRVAHVDFDPHRPHLLAAAAARLLVAEEKPAAVGSPARNRTIGWIAVMTVAAAGLALMLGLSDAPFRNPAPAAPEFVFMFRAHGDWVEAAAAAPAPGGDTRPVHMRAAVRTQRARLPVVVRVEINGRSEEHTIRPKGLSSDGLSVGEVRVRLVPGEQSATVELWSRPAAAGGASRRWTRTWTAVERRRHVLAYEPEAGFIWSP
jgi:ferredoxin/coenzyme F420-reducing hydrogenase delta subunit